MSAIPSWYHLPAGSGGHRHCGSRDVFEWLFDSMSRRLSLLSHHFAMLYIHWSSGLVQV